jgi:hypothetical protein
MKYDEEGNLVVWNEGRELLESTPRQTIPANHVRVIYDNMSSGSPWWEASPYYAITREVAGFILANGIPTFKR